MHYETRALFSSTKSWIYDKEKFEQVKVILFYKYVMELNTFLFDPTVPEIDHSRFGHAQVTSTYVQAVAQ